MPPTLFKYQLFLKNERDGGPGWLGWFNMRLLISVQGMIPELSVEPASDPLSFSLSLPPSASLSLSLSQIKKRREALRKKGYSCWRKCLLNFLWQIIIKWNQKTLRRKLLWWTRKEEGKGCRPSNSLTQAPSCPPCSWWLYREVGLLNGSQKRFLSAESETCSGSQPPSTTPEGHHPKVTHLGLFNWMGHLKKLFFFNVGYLRRW